MTSKDPEPDRLQEAEGAFQYSLRSLLIVMTVVAILCSLIFPSPRWVAYLTLAFLATVLPAALTIVLVYGPRCLRAFCIGALFPAGAFLYGVMSTFPYYLLAQSSLPPVTDEERLTRALFVAADIAGSIAAGLVAVAVRWMVQSWQKQRQQTPPPPDEPA